MISSEVIRTIFENLAIQMKNLSEAELSRIDKGTHQISLKVIKKKNIQHNIKELPDNKKKELLENLQKCKSREDGLLLLNDLLNNKNELEQFARFLEVRIIKKDKVDKIKNQIIEATIGATLRSNAIQGENT